MQPYKQTPLNVRISLKGVQYVQEQHNHLKHKHVVLQAALGLKDKLSPAHSRLQKSDHGRKVNADARQKMLSIN